jgi:hypothetical protein
VWGKTKFMNSIKNVLNLVVGTFGLQNDDHHAPDRSLSNTGSGIEGLNGFGQHFATPRTQNRVVYLAFA